MMNRSRCFSVLALVLAASLIVSTGTQASAPLPVITVDVSNPSAVVFSGTLNPSLATDSSVPFAFGIDLVSFFTIPIFTPAPTAVAGGSTLAPFIAPTPYSFWNADNIPGGPIGLGSTLNLSAPSGTPQVFSFGVPAFTGTLTVDLSAQTGFLPAVGSSGAVITGNSFAAGPTVGFWEVVAIPEPSAFALGLMGMAGLGLVIRRRQYSR